MIIGIDIGTTGTKTVLLNDKGAAVHYSYEGYGCNCPQPNHVEQSIDDILHAVIKTVRTCAAHVPAGCAVDALSVSVQSGTLVPLKPNGEPFGNAISWLDTRCGKECAELLEQYGESLFYRKTGWKLGASFNFIQICKLRRDLPAETADLLFANVSDCVTHLLVGEYVTDVNSAGNLQLLNVEEGRWDLDLLELADIRETQLGRLAPCGAFLGYVRPDTAKLLGLHDRVRVYAGAQDQYCAAIGAGVHHPGDSMLSTGTSWVLMSISEKPMFDEVRYPAVAKHIVGDHYASFVYTPAGGSALKWLKNSVLAAAGQDDALTYDALTEAAAAVPAGAGELLFLPYLGGTLYPSWNIDMKGMFHGLDFSHDRRHITRAVLEGVALELNLLVRNLRAQGLRMETLRALGGATRSDLWMQIVSDVTGMPIVASSVADVAPIGAAMIAAVGCGMFPDYAAAYESFASLSERREFCPDSAAHAFYCERFGAYERLNESLQRG